MIKIVSKETLFSGKKYVETSHLINSLTLYSIITPFDPSEISCISKNIMENGAFDPTEQMLYFP